MLSYFCYNHSRRKLCFHPVQSSKFTEEIDEIEDSSHFYAYILLSYIKDLVPGSQMPNLMLLLKNNFTGSRTLATGSLAK